MAKSSNPDGAREHSELTAFYNYTSHAPVGVAIFLTWRVGSCDKQIERMQVWRVRVCGGGASVLSQHEPNLRWRTHVRGVGDAVRVPQ